MRTAWRLLAVVGVAFLLHGRSAAAQVPYDACRDRHDQVIPGVVDNTIGYAGMATYRDGHPVIEWNAKTNQRLSTTEQIFIYLHECAHHTLGHLWKSSDEARFELEADCWAIQLMVDGGMIGGRHLAELERSRRTVRGDQSHLGGEAHVRSLRQCLEVRTDRKAWAAALDGFVRASADSFATTRGRAVDTVAAGVVYESSLDAPGTYDCEVTGPVLRCLVFAARKEKAAAERFEDLERLIRDWLPVGWTSLERPATGDGGRTFLAQDGTTGTLIALVQAGARVHLVIRRTPV
jgi:hypothetical protein